MEPGHKRELIRLSIIFGIVFTLGTFFFLGWLFALGERDGQQHHENGNRQLQEQQSGRNPLPTTRRFSYSHSLFTKTR